ncbi:exodeoxyribonuclease VII small subunit [Nesterenkonia halotolerans]|uniref:Exodeoxyribonuclease 7 small subunit n=1 Tax=Nesterenkonia halotolerans TaxID=225325 RepID=A0ABR9JA21_9MICC|nr:exodeoxyribonuclease VII small subunit [Nesterenkonia halotolerans]MBE1515856.1 exodeoxyribonuclease VII small subunit [Nesterenkonia halotolerans]
MTEAPHAGESAGSGSTASEFAAAQTQDIETMSYERAREELVAVVTKLETGGAPLEESLALWQRGEALADRCERWLDGARTRLEEVRAELTEDS